MSSLIQSEKERREKERRQAGGVSYSLTPADAQNPHVAAGSGPAPQPNVPGAVAPGRREGSGRPGDFATNNSPAPTPAPQRQQPERQSDIQPVTRQQPQRQQSQQVSRKVPGRSRRDVLGAQDHNMWQGWWRDRVREGLTDNDGDGRYEVPFWAGLGNSIFGGSDSRYNGNEAIAERERARRRDREARELAQQSGVMDELGLSDDMMYTPEAVQGAISRITRQREQADQEGTRGHDLEVIDRGNVPTMAQIESNETIAEGDRGAQIQMNSDNNDVTRRGQDQERDLTLLGLENDLDLAEIQRLAAQDQISAQNQLAQMQYQQQLKMWQMDNESRKEERAEERRSDSLSALLAGLASLGAAMSL